MTEQLRQRPGDQPLPTPGQLNVQDALIDLIKERRALGIERYGRPLQTFNGRNAVRDLLEELLDGATYAMQVEMEIEQLKAERDALAAQYAEALGEPVEELLLSIRVGLEARRRREKDLTVTRTDPVEEVVCSTDAIEEIRRRFGVTEAQTGIPGVSEFMGIPVFVDDELPPGTVRMQPRSPKQQPPLSFRQRSQHP